MYSIIQNTISTGAICLSMAVTPRYIEVIIVNGSNKNQIANKENMKRDIVYESP